MEIDNILHYLDTFLTIMGALAIIKAIMFIFLYFNEKDNYIGFIYKYFSDQSNNISTIKDQYAIRYELDIYDLDKNIENTYHEYFLIGCPGKVIKNISLMEYTNKLPKCSKKLQYKKVLIKDIPNIYPDEFLLVKCPSFETIPAYKLVCRVEGVKVEIEFSYNGLYGMYDKNYIKVKHDLYSFIHHFFHYSI